MKSPTQRRKYKVKNMLTTIRREILNVFCGRKFVERVFSEHILYGKCYTRDWFHNIETENINSSGMSTQTCEFIENNLTHII